MSAVAWKTLVSAETSSADLSFAAGPTSVSATRSDTPAAALGNVSCAHVAAGRRVLGERQVMADCCVMLQIRDRQQ